MRGSPVYSWRAKRVRRHQAPGRAEPLSERAAPVSATAARAARRGPKQAGRARMAQRPKPGTPQHRQTARDWMPSATHGHNGGGRQLPIPVLSAAGLGLRNAGIRPASQAGLPGHALESPCLGARLENLAPAWRRVPDQAHADGAEPGGQRPWQRSKRSPGDAAASSGISLARGDQPHQPPPIVVRRNENATHRLEHPRPDQGRSGQATRPPGKTPQPPVNINIIASSLEHQRA